MKPIIIIPVLGGLILLLLLAGAPVKPLRLVGQSIVKLLIGALFLFFLNAVGNQFGLHVPINFITSAISGFLGLPGLFSLIAIQMWVL
ncbi:pro-sigmaK processing inhibitor BofA family protein [Bacillus aquiflavi]|uniref:Pro-sigmaK processing inhibitor BofA n=1 Tax=Bacillus aquiflavi TaxID=2672567 RepID=A0A6B3VV97_9BACI|nr:pro-sigmaK processing inhibitor BofA family protein [Bacillus aquiflavi]MBA4537682.1 pro-sigmaK processing inhibitor BofA family protein [Bacillus aquiflavi]NEY81939.1 pro-sigmaK processing inhibitor BofA [Bacillus aquiflavi]UAC48206.1 pro-sigmaK processing inhibitor BofA family protein [Bacillus aquiflavi]